jgi:hypothetical protein
MSTTRALAAAIIVPAILWGCSQLQIQTGGPPSASATRLDCDSAHPNDCKVKIIDPCWICSFKIQYDEIHLKRANSNIKIVWQLPDGYVFCKRASSDGGVVLKGTNDDQFNGMSSTDDPNGGNPSDPDCKKHPNFRWNAVNTMPRPDYGYGYTVNFYRKSDSKPYTIDPWIYND